MGPLQQLGTAPDELIARVRDEAWEGWVRTEPVLRALAGFEELRQWRGPDADQMLGALVRLAAEDGGDDPLAAVAITYQLSNEMRRMAYDLRDLSPGMDGIAVSELWLQVRTFPWRRVKHAYATHLLRSTRHSLLEEFRPRAGRRRRVLLLPPEELTSDRRRNPDGADELLEDSRAELADFLAWCVRRRKITPDDSTLMLDIAIAGWRTSHLGMLDLKRGACSLHALTLVADARGVSVKTVLRQRDRVLARLRQAVSDYVDAVA